MLTWDLQSVKTYKKASACGPTSAVNRLSCCLGRVLPANEQPATESGTRDAHTATSSCCRSARLHKSLGRIFQGPKGSVVFVKFELLIIFSISRPIMEAQRSRPKRRAVNQITQLPGQNIIRAWGTTGKAKNCPPLAARR